MNGSPRETRATSTSSTAADDFRGKIDIRHFYFQTKLAVSFGSKGFLRINKYIKRYISFSGTYLDVVVGALRRVLLQAIAHRVPHRQALPVECTKNK